MKLFLMDLWHDLREKRLAPVAVALAAGLIAVPVVLSKPSEAPEPAAPDKVVRTAPDPKELKALASVKLDESAMGARGSSLDTFDPANPFRPPRAIEKRAEQKDGAGSTVTGEAAQTPDSTGGNSGGDTGSTGGGNNGSTGGGDTGSGGGGDGGGTTTTVQYRYVVDLTLTVNGRTRRVRNMERLDMLPSQKSPLLLYLGVSPNAGNAVFLVDSTLEAAGEGSCKPRRSDCAFLYLGAGSEHAFTNSEGDSYTLRIDEIRKVRHDGTAAASKSKRAGAAVGAPTKTRRFVPRLLADLVSVSSDGTGDSNDNQDSR
jgi:hypothetical protein